MVERRRGKRGVVQSFSTHETDSCHFQVSDIEDYVDENGGDYDIVVQDVSSFIRGLVALLMPMLY